MGGVNHGKMCHGVGGESWVDQRIPQVYIHDVSQVKGLVNLLPSQNPFMPH